ncbi:hypothetical protein EDC56_2836 [Sinobacterium caligoides]|uniref:Uncharacterized protein n=1 Tax=Sinobacterium caligoides TaxID=933926 RepID=A0A3N2DK94_9GAMM|nr:hypothetical protein [Sinobacterium caligoides]ROS00198.1 hypothetical protein EDC56_2836 [Sinobacterium caligoides]
MFNSLKYNRLRLRTAQGRTTPVGPSFNINKELEINLADNILSLAMPRHAPYNRNREQARILSKRYELRGVGYNDGVLPSNTWKAETIAFRSWGYYGPWFTGYMADLSIYIGAIHLSEPQDNISFFHPKAFELATLSYLTALHGHDEYSPNTPRWQGPLNWQPILCLPVPAIRLDIHPINVPSRRYHNVFFPVSKDKIIKITFTYSHACAGSMEQRDERINLQPLRQMIDDIVGSLALTLSPESELQMASIDAAGAAISNSMPPLNWPADVDPSGIGIIQEKNAVLPN